MHGQRDNLLVAAEERNREVSDLYIDEVSHPIEYTHLHGNLSGYNNYRSAVCKYFLFDVKLLLKLFIKRLMKLSKKDVLFFVLFYILVVTAQAMMVFGINFWIHSFGKKYAKSNAYVTIFMPALCWMALNMCIAIPYEILIAPYLTSRYNNKCTIDVHINDINNDDCTQRILKHDNNHTGNIGGIYGGSTMAHVPAPALDTTGHYSDRSITYSDPKEVRMSTVKGTILTYSLMFWINDKKAILLIIVIGIMDAMTGLLCAYSIPHVNIPVQQAIGACTCIIVYVGNIALYPESACRFHWMLCVSFGFLLAGCACSIVIETGRPQGTLWGVIYFIGIMSSVINMILQGRFLSIYNGKVSPIANRLAVLTGDFVVQIFVTIAMFPLDFAPWFGKNNNAHDSWVAFTDGLHCLVNTNGDCPGNMGYFFIFIFGTLFAKWLSTICSLYSPTLYGFCVQLTNPVNALIIIIFPALNINGSHEYAGWTLATLLLPIGAPVFFIFVNEGFRQLKDEQDHH